MTMRAMVAAALIICAAASVQAKDEAAGTPAAKAAVSAQAKDQAGTAAKHDLENGKAKYKLFCVACHGASGKGDGVAAAALDPKPADHSSKKVMGALKDEYLFKVIKEGGAAVKKSPTMAAWGAALKDDDIHDVVAYIRTLAK